jgi:hypothetical protein
MPSAIWLARRAACNDSDFSDAEGPDEPSASPVVLQSVSDRRWVPNVFAPSAFTRR